eukprot:CAMPEP_0172910240 /NCGR_PEP_ID=MMETSP1075-20121228/184250_1 /TAXON_ID=2916 /ORGANISM="Ceratium fusus, Strain PA161109" /LENGTH=559 /DNA_ID=CAMNT_0013768337 /DNA_START=14 /DNA_END=1690 /DNA_ORIENTATION=-
MNAAFNALDTNHDGVISRQEFGAAMSGGSARSGVSVNNTIPASTTMVGGPCVTTYGAPGTMASSAGQTMLMGQKLLVDVLKATGLHHMNHFTGDNPYVQCEVKHVGRHAQTTRATTKPVTVGDTLNPVWGERLELHPWQPGEDLEFTVYDKGLIGSKTEGKAHLPSGRFYPNGFTGNLEISGLPGALLEIVVHPAGGSISASAMQGTAMFGGGTMVMAKPMVTSTTIQQPVQTMAAYPVPSMPASVATGMQAGAFTTMVAPPVYVQEQAATAVPPQTYMAPQPVMTQQAPVVTVQPITMERAPVVYSAPQAPQIAPQVQVREKYVDVPQIQTREVEKRVIVPQFQEKIVEVPRVEVREVEKKVMVPQVQEVIKEVPRVEIQTVEKVVEVPQIQYQERIVEVPHIQTQEIIKHVPKIVVQEVVKEMKKIQVQSVEKIVEVPQVQYTERVVEVPDVQIKEVIKHVPRVEIQEVVKQVARLKLQTVEKIVEVPHVQTVERIVEVPQIVEVPAPQVTYSSTASPPTRSYSAPMPAAASVSTMIRPSAAFSVAQTSMPMQTYAA